MFNVKNYFIKKKCKKARDMVIFGMSSFEFLVLKALKYMSKKDDTFLLLLEKLAEVCTV